MLAPEWARQGGALLVWPHAGTDWAASLDRILPVYERLGAEIARRQPLLLLCADRGLAVEATARLASAGAPRGRLRVVVVDHDDTWIRDYGPLTVLGDEARLVDFRFNGWGGRYPAGRDDAVTAELARRGCFGLPLRRVDRVLEGGAIDTDGNGTVIALRRCLLDPRRNPDLDAAATQELLATELGCRRLLWLEHGWLQGDDTDGHVDNLVRFVSRDCLVHLVCEDTSDAHYAPLNDLAGELAALRQPDGRPYRLVPLPLPRPLTGSDGRRLPASHVNFLIINDAVLLPVFDDPTDAIAATRLAAVMPDRSIVPLPARPLLEQGGGPHCATLQLPAGALRP